MSNIINRLESGIAQVEADTGREANLILMDDDTFREFMNYAMSQCETIDMVIGKDQFEFSGIPVVLSRSMSGRRFLRVTYSPEGTA